MVLEKRKAAEEQRIKEQETLYMQYLAASSSNNAGGAPAGPVANLNSREATARERVLSAKLEKARLETPPQPPVRT